MMKEISVAAAGQPARPHTVKRAPLLERVFSGWFRRIHTGRLTVQFPSGREERFVGTQDGPDATLRIFSNWMIFRMLTNGDVGLAEAYRAGEWETPDLSDLLSLGLRNVDALSDALDQSWLTAAVNRLRHLANTNTRRGSRRNISAHYDLGNAFYGAWLDPTMTYSSALFEGADELLDEAQLRKYRRLASRLDLQPGERILEIGCGWGGFAEVAAAEFGCQVVCLTLSVEQGRFARARMARAGLSDRVDIRLQDYRDVTGTFDKIASIEMFEAVGEAYWPVYLATLRNRLAPGGRAALQIITVADEHFDAYRRSADFIQRYIFPGGMLPSPQVFQGAVEAAGLKLSETFFFGASYAETLHRWDRAFQDNWERIVPLGFDDRFYRLWRYYLMYCAVGFDTGRIDVGHFVIEHR